MSARSRADGFEHEEEQELETVQDRGLLLRLVRYLRPYRPMVAVALVLIVAVAGLGLVGPLLVRAAIDGTLDSTATAAARYRDLGRIALLWFAVLVATAGLHYVQLMVLQSTGQRVMLDLRRQLFRHLLSQDHYLFDRQPVGRLMTRLTSDIEALNELFTSGLVTVATDVFTLVAIMGVMLWLDWRLALLSFTVIPVLFVLALVFRSRVRRAFRRIRVRVARINSFLQEHIAGITLVQGFGQTRQRLARFEALNLRHTEAHLETVSAFAVFFPAVEVISTAAVVLLLWQGGSWTASGTVTIGTLVAFVQYAQRFYRPISDLSEKFNILQGAMAASERIFALLDTPPRITAPARPSDLDPNPDADAKSNASRSATRNPLRKVTPRIEFDNVHFAYTPLDPDAHARRKQNRPAPESRPVLRGLNLDVRPGERVAIVGSTGAGKTTLISLLLRFYDVDSGSIRLGGRDVREFDPQELRRHMALVLQEPRLFSGSLRDNLTLWDDDFDQERLEDAVRRVGLDRVVNRLKHGLDEEMREGGGRLSTGERQLAAFARALAHDPAVLILDEATASVDTETESRIQAATQEVMQGRTSIVIAHRLATVRDADRIVVLHHGRLVEEGTHAELMEHGQLYRRLVEMQMGLSAANGA